MEAHDILGLDVGALAHEVLDHIQMSIPGGFPGGGVQWGVTDLSREATIDVVGSVRRTLVWGTGWANESFGVGFSSFALSTIRK